MKTQLIVEGIKVDMYDDEDVIMNKNVQDVKDIGKILADFSQAFTLPATARNNTIFEHYYNNDIDGALNPHLKIPATLEVEGLQVESGYIELTNVNLEVNRPESYSVAFFASIANLTRVFAEDELNVLDISDLDHTVNYDNIKDSWGQSLLSGDILYPFFNYERPWIYSTDAGAPTVNNIAASSAGVQVGELKPAIRMKAIVDRIASHYSLTFASPDVFNATWFTRLYMTLHNFAGDNIDEIERKNNLFSVEFVPTGSYSLIPANGIEIITLADTIDPGNHFASNTFTVFANGNHTFFITLEGSHTTAGNVEVYIYVNGSQSGSSHVITGTANSNFFAQFQFVRNLATGDLVTFRYRAITATASIEFVRARLTNFPSLTYNQNTDLNASWPKMKIVDFMQSLCEMFNMIITFDGTSYTFTPLEEYYNDGQIKDFNSKIDRENVTVNKMPIFRKVSFAYAEAEDAPSATYLNRTNRAYGSSAFVPKVDFATEEIEINPKFSITPLVELVDQDKTGLTIAGTGIHYGRLLSTDDKPIIDNPRIFFYSRVINCSPFYLQNGVSTGGSPTFTQQTFIPLCNAWSDQPMLTTGQSLTFSIEQPTIGRASSRNLYQLYWNKFIQRTFNRKSRLLNVKMRFTIADYLNLSLNDKIYFDGHYYTYNTIAVNLNKEEATAELVSYYPDYIPRQAKTIDDIGNVTWEGGSSDLIVLEDELIGTTPNGLIFDISTETHQDIISTSPSNPINFRLPLGDLSYTHNQDSESLTWTVTHNLGKKPAVQTFDSAGSKIEGLLMHTDNNSCVIYFERGLIGTAYCN